MANSITPTYSFTLPEVGADTNAWGGHINGNFTTIDTQMLSRTLTSAQTMAGALNLPSNGLNVGSGQLQVTGGNVTASGNITATGNLSGANGVFSGTLSATGAATLSSTLAVTGAVTFSSTVTASTAPSVGGHLTNKTYVDGVKTTVDAYTVSAGTGLTGGGAINTSPTISISAGGVGATQLASNAVTTAKISDTNVTTAKLADNAVTTVKISDGNITAAKLNGAQSGSAPIFGARAWAHVANSGTASIVADGNIASVSRAGAGLVDVSFTTAMPDANYAISATVYYSGLGAYVATVTNKTAASFRVQTVIGTSAADVDFMFSVFR